MKASDARPILLYIRARLHSLQRNRDAIVKDLEDMTREPEGRVEAARLAVALRNEADGRIEELTGLQKFFQSLIKEDQ